MRKILLTWKWKNLEKHVISPNLYIGVNYFYKFIRPLNQVQLLNNLAESEFCKCIIHHAFFLFPTKHNIMRELLYQKLITCSKKYKEFI